MSYLDRIDSYREEMLQTLQELIAIPSVVTDAEEGAPFGAAVQRAYEYMMEKGRAQGFELFDADHYGGHMEFGRGPEAMGILAHLDVVPAGEGWDYPPFGGVVENGRIYGRGAQDDKGPAVAAFYAMKALKDEGIEPAKKVRLILGLDEEVDWQGMKYYLSKTKAPDFSVSPDADFPVIHGEMGVMIFEIAGKFGRSKKEGLLLRSITGGNAPNMVADWARALVNGPDYDGVREKLKEYRELTGYKIKATGRGKSLEIYAEGVSAHGATPWMGQNAITVLMGFLGKLEFINEDHNEFIRFYNRHLGADLDGSALGCGFEDELSGKLVLNVGQIKMEEDGALVTVNIRYPISSSDQAVYDAMAPALNRYDLGVVKVDHKAPIFTPKDDPLVVKLMEAYRAHTGDMESEPIIIGGGTYARAVPHAVAFGISFPGDPEVVHQKNEYVEIESLMKSARIYADAIYRLTVEEETHV